MQDGETAIGSGDQHSYRWQQKPSRQMRWSPEGDPGDICVLHVRERRGHGCWRIPGSLGRAQSVPEVVMEGRHWGPDPAGYVEREKVAKRKSDS